MTKLRRLNPRCAVSIGKRSHLAVQLARDMLGGGWHTLFGRFRTVPEAVSWLRAHPTCGQDCTLVLIQWDRRMDAAALVRPLRAARRKLVPVVCAHCDLPGDVVVDALEGGVVDILGPAGREYIRDQLVKLSTKGTVHERLSRIKLPRKKQLTAFGVLPYNPLVRQVWEIGIAPALSRISIDLVLAKDRPSNLVLNNKIRMMIKESDFVIADISMVAPLCGNKPSSRCWGCHNPNVYYEIGYAHGIGKNVLLLRDGNSPARMTVPVPTDIQGIEWLIYNDMTHASLTLYHGLKR